ncbi:wax ester/triacylglycerol synthase family O-acyltransferase [Lentzea sp. NBC_00516]|uniref:wax ester/triacylglycerol synthase family O-acyltransferase n=1 Tax=Lentzea sp. NBC_00516 TaxID=2903582 RepID=UPI002E804404|nr:wax ester/triacylglycerol synthase family O-acyltransferase [Lentzea sp. NBC_00516]WUD25502.1 wax ester/triacylglycerol synthase family O-acyltransferase [Lentzea sp. NBC_00516]
MTDHLSPLDIAFLAMEGDSNPLHLGAVATFAPSTPVHPARIAAVLCERAQEIPRLRQRARTSMFGGARWVEDPGFAPEDHVFTHHVRGRDRFATLVSHLMAQPLDLARPPWELHVITGLAGGRFAVVAKLHHSLCDGMKAVGLGIQLFDPSRLSIPDAPQPVVKSIIPSLPSLRGIKDTFDIASSVLMNTRPPTLNSPVLTASTRPRRVVMSRLDLADVHRIRRAHGGTVNDVLLALVTGALRHWLSAHGSAGTDSVVRALIPVNQRSRSGDGASGNQISGFLVALPVGETDPAQRLRNIRAQMESAKAAGPDRGAGALPLLADKVPPLVHRLAAPVMGRCAPLLFDTLVTSVPLPSVPLALDGAALCEMYPVAPVAPGHAVGIALSVYRNSVHVCLNTNQSWMSDAQWLDGVLRRELVALQETRELVGLPR